MSVARIGAPRPPHASVAAGDGTVLRAARSVAARSHVWNAFVERWGGDRALQFTESTPTRISLLIEFMERDAARARAVATRASAATAAAHRTDVDFFEYAATKASLLGLLADAQALQVERFRDALFETLKALTVRYHAENDARPPPALGDDPERLSAEQWSNIVAQMKDAHFPNVYRQAREDEWTLRYVDEDLKLPTYRDQVYASMIMHQTPIAAVDSTHKMAWRSVHGSPATSYLGRCAPAGGGGNFEFKNMRVFRVWFQIRNEIVAQHCDDNVYFLADDDSPAAVAPEHYGFNFRVKFFVAGGRFFKTWYGRNVDRGLYSDEFFNGNEIKFQPGLQPISMMETLFVRRPHHTERSYLREAFYPSEYKYFMNQNARDIDHVFKKDLYFDYRTHYGPPNKQIMLMAFICEFMTVIRHASLNDIAQKNYLVVDRLEFLGSF